MVLASLPLAILGLLSSSSAVLAADVPDLTTVVGLRIEGRTHTIFEGLVITNGHNVTTASGGTHHCDGTNNNANPGPGPTGTSALDDAARAHGFTWDGTFFTDFDDYFITSIGGDAQTDTEFWGILLDFRLTPVGGCQQRVKFQDNLLWAFDAFNKAHFLKLEGPHTAHRNQPVTLTVTDGATGGPIAGAAVRGQTSDADGRVSVTFGDVGVEGVKAEKSDSLRSNKLEIVVLP